MENKIEIHNMNLHYGDFHALHDINLDIKENEITAFIGPSGCGKSTLLRSLNRMNDLVENCRITGDIMLDGRDIYKNCDVNLLRRRVGMVFQKPNPFPMSIYDNIAYGPRTHGIKSRVQLDEIVETSLKRAAIWEETKDNLKKSALSMSGGQQQCQRGRFNRSEDGRHHRDVLRGIIPLEQRRLEMRDARHQDIADQEQQHRKGQHSRAVHQTLEHSRRRGAVHLFGLCLCAHCRFRSRNSFSCHASFLLLRTENARLMSRMNTNSTTPVAISASRCRPVA